MRPAELAEAEIATVDPDADPEFAAGAVGDRLAIVFPVPGFPAVLDCARSQHRLPGVIVLPDRKVENSHDGIADGLVEEAVMLPDGVGALVIEGVEQSRHFIRGLRLR